MFFLLFTGENNIRNFPIYLFFNSCLCHVKRIRVNTRKNVNSRFVTFFPQLTIFLRNTFSLFITLFFFHFKTFWCDFCLLFPLWSRDQTCTLPPQGRGYIPIYVRYAPERVICVISRILFSYFLFIRFVFLIPAESGEKITLGISTMLNMTVFLMTVMSGLPPTDQTPILSEFILLR